MRRTLSVLIALVSAAAAEAAEPAEKDILALEQRWAEAMQSQDLDALDPIMHERFRLITTYDGGWETNRADWLLNAIHRMQFDKVEMSRQKVSVQGDVATVSMRMELDWSFLGEKRPGSYDLVDTWVKTADGWKVLQRVSSAPDTD